MNKTQDIKEFLLRGHTLTSADAFRMFGCTRLADVVYRLRKKGLNIVGKMVTGKDMYGNRCDYCCYYIDTTEE